MEYWGKKIHVSREIAAQQVAIYRSFPPEKRLQIALDFGNMAITRTREWIKSKHPEFSEREITLEYVRLIHFESGELPAKTWHFYKMQMEKLIRKEWADRFRRMMKAKNWTYDDVAKWGGFKNGKVVEATVSRGLPAFARLAVVLFEQGSLVDSRQSTVGSRQ